MRKVCECYLSKSFGQEQGYACAIDKGIGFMMSKYGHLSGGVSVMFESILRQS